MKFATLTKRTKAESPCQSYKDSIFPFSGVLILKGKRKKSSPPLHPLLCSGCFPGRQQQHWDSQIKKPLPGWDRLCSSSLPSAAPFYSVCRKSRQNMVALAFLIKEAGEKRGSWRQLKEGRKPTSTDSQNSLLESERAQGGGRGRRTGVES